MLATQRFKITDVRTHRARVIELRFDARDMPGWDRGVHGWSIGSIGSGAALEIDAAFQGSEIGIFPASNHVLLWGRAPSEIPDVFHLCGGFRGSVESALHAVGLLTVSGRRWERVPQDVLRRDADAPDRIRLRFDRQPIRIGYNIIEMAD